MVWVADDLAAWLVERLADAALQKLTNAIFGDEFERALRPVATAAVRAVAAELSEGDPARAEHLARVIGEVFTRYLPEPPEPGSTVLEALQGGIMTQIARRLEDRTLTIAPGVSSASAEGIADGVIGPLLAQRLVARIVFRGARGGPLAPLAVQLNFDAVQFAIRQAGHQTQAQVSVLSQVCAEILAAVKRAGPAALAPPAPPGPPGEPARLPAAVIDRLRRDFPDQLSGEPGPWTADTLRELDQSHSSGEQSGELAYRLKWLRVGLAALDLLQICLGASGGLASRLEPAWREVLQPLHRIPHPADRFGYIEQIVLHGDEGQVIEFLARAIGHSGDDSGQDGIYQWAARELGADAKTVDDALARAAAPQDQQRLVINFGMTIAADGEEDDLPESVIAWLYRSDGMCHETFERPFGPDGDVAEMVAELAREAHVRSGRVTHIDVALPVSLFGSPSRPESARIRLRRSLTKPVAASSEIAVRWADRILDADLRADGLRQGREIGAEASALRWVAADTYGEIGQMHEELMARVQGIAFEFSPADPMWFYAAAYGSPYVVWVESAAEHIEDIRRQVTPLWQSLPLRLSKEFSRAEPSAIRRIRAVWDDPDWLENVVPNLIDPDQRLSV